ncbi:MAG TPA: hypothetical protein VJ654_02260 [Noviherbaspirillum sp.]|nr:hypothetical protein [Noviherbaspirillum sp.]
MKKIVYVALGGEPPSPEGYAYLAKLAREHVKVLTQRMKVSTKAGEPVEIEFIVSTESNTAEEQKIFFNAFAGPRGHRKYQIGIGVGYLARLELLSRALVADKTVLRGSTNSKLTSEQARKDGRNKVMSDFYFHYLITLVFMHELAHIVLGHVDWNAERRKQRELYEFFALPLTPEQRAEMRVLEADADHQAAKWAISMFDYSLQVNPHFKYKALPDQFYDFGHLLASKFQLAEATEPDIPKEKRTHPDNDTRVVVSLAFLADYFEKYRPEHVQRFMEAAINGALESLGHTIHSKSKAHDLTPAIIFMLKNGEQIDKLGVRHYLLKVEVGDGSFSVAESTEPAY